MSNWAGANGVTALVSPYPGISTSSPNGAATSSCSSSPRSMRTVFGGLFDIRIRETSSRPVVAGCGSTLALPCSGLGFCRWAAVVELWRFGGGSSAAARVEIASNTSITTTSRRAATPIA
jgi:hypothetical protein